MLKAASVHHLMKALRWGALVYRPHCVDAALDMWNAKEWCASGSLALQVLPDCAGTLGTLAPPRRDGQPPLIFLAKVRARCVRSSPPHPLPVQEPTGPSMQGVGSQPLSHARV